MIKMKFNKTGIFWSLCFVLASVNVTGQDALREDNQSKFGPFMYRQGSVYRSATGKPGPKYWQSTADYTINVALDDGSHVLKGNMMITYTNNSPETLDFVWMSLEQNRFTETSRGTLTTPIGGDRYAGDVDGGVHHFRTSGQNREKEQRFVKVPYHRYADAGLLQRAHPCQWGNGRNFYGVFL